MSQNEKKGICFVIMPFGDASDQYYERVYKPGVLEADLEPIRVDDLSTSSPIIKDIWTLTNDAMIILADLTGTNPNVMYELGLAHGIPKPVIIVAESIDEVPFDLQHQRVFTYNKDNPEWGTILRKKITNAINETLEAPESAIIPIFLEVKPETEKVTVTEHQKELLEIKTDLEQIKRSLHQMPKESSRIPFRHFTIHVKDKGRIGMKGSRHLPETLGPGNHYQQEGVTFTISEEDFDRLISNVIEPTIKDGKTLSRVKKILVELSLPVALIDEAIQEYKRRTLVST